MYWPGKCYMGHRSPTHTFMNAKKGEVQLHITPFTHMRVLYMGHRSLTHTFMNAKKGGSSRTSHV